MSRQNVDIVRRGWDAFLAGSDKGDFGAAFDAGVFAPGATLTPSLQAAGSKTYVGREGFVEWTRTWTEDWLDWKLWIEEVVDAGDDHVVTIVGQSGKGRGSGATVDLRFAVVHTLADGLITDHRHYIDIAEAFEVAGLPERGGSAGHMEPLALIEFPADDPERALRFWSGLLGVTLEPRTEAQGSGWQSAATAPPVGVHERGQGPGDTFSLPYFAVDDLPHALEQVRALGGTVVHPGEAWAICKDSEGTPFGLSLVPSPQER